MANGWAGDTAVHDQMESDIADAVGRARASLPYGGGSAHCLDCGEAIPVDRREALPGVCRCVGCQAQHDDPAAGSAYNRRGSKDSQLR